MTQIAYLAEIARLKEYNELKEFRRVRSLEPDEQPCVCSVFGCGHHLSPQEQLYGSRCPEHSIKQAAVDPTAFTVYK